MGDSFYERRVICAVRSRASARKGGSPWSVAKIAPTAIATSSWRMVSLDMGAYLRREMPDGREGIRARGAKLRALPWKLRDGRAKPPPRDGGAKLPRLNVPDGRAGALGRNAGAA